MRMTAAQGSMHGCDSSACACPQLRGAGFWLGLKHAADHFSASQMQASKKECGRTELKLPSGCMMRMCTIVVCANSMPC